ncbi:prolactin-8A9-like [Psammomys obesus]|uniref:prolactin-8A9-like n=1 Tax=Psammomys obesus TaxID=48139 RepID=UPI002453481A|nr:prolactin-8A9-like [Psammomys obesus]
MTQEEAKGNPPEREKYVTINLLTFPGDIRTWFTYEHDFLLSHGYAYPWGLSASIYSRRKPAECMTPVKQLTRVSTHLAWELLSDGAAIESTSLLEKHINLPKYCQRLYLSCQIYNTKSCTGTLLLLVMSNLLLWEKAAAILPSLAKEGDCTEPLVETFNNAINRAETVYNLAVQMYQEFLTKMLREDYPGFTARNHCHAKITNPPYRRNELIYTPTEKYLKMLINFVGAWNAPLYHLVVELSAMDDVPETILSKAKEIEENNRELLDDLRWIFTKGYPTEKLQENFPNWQHLPYIKSSLRNDQFLAIFNLSNCLRSDIHFTIFHLKNLKYRITRKNC